jgi:hypothetical protein
MQVIMNKDDNNQKYNLLWKNVIIKKGLSLKHVDDCISIFMYGKKKIYLDKKICEDNDDKKYRSLEEILADESDNTDIDNKNMHTSLNYIKVVLEIHGL